jgi:hypothetical protein
MDQVALAKKLAMAPKDLEYCDSVFSQLQSQMDELLTVNVFVFDQEQYSSLSITTRPKSTQC